MRVRAGNKLVTLDIIDKNDGRLWLSFGFNRDMITLIKTQFGGWHWHGFEDPPIKMWSIANSHQNRFRIAYLAYTKDSPYELFDTSLERHQRTKIFQETTPKLFDLCVELGSEECVHSNDKIFAYRPLRDAQQEMIDHGIQRRTAILACEMGTGKSLCAGEVLEYFMREEELRGEDVWYVGPKSGIIAVQRDFIKWSVDHRIWPKYWFTYYGLRKHIVDYTSPAPKVLIIDEASKIKNGTAKQSKACLHVAESMRDEYDNPIILELSGTPAPKDPSNWWHLCHVARPGFLSEGSVYDLKKRLSLTEMRESQAGGQYPHPITWFDNSKKCKHCGNLPDVHNELHEYEASVNEIYKLHERMTGLVLVKTLEDCGDIPERQEENVYVTPTPEILRSANLIKNTARSAIVALTQSRLLSDGIFYGEEEDGTETCGNCHGKGVCDIKEVIDQEVLEPIGHEIEYRMITVTCDYCGGKKVTPKYKKKTDIVNSPKDEALLQELEDHEDIGRLIIWCGFTGTIDKVMDMVIKAGWTVLRVDGRGYHGFDSDDLVDYNILLNAMDYSHPDRLDLYKEFSKVCFIGQPGAGGMALTLTASPTMIYYSMDFNGESYEQSLARNRRLGMPTGRPITVKYFLHLACDEVVLNNVRKKVELEKMSMGELRKQIEEVEDARNENNTDGPNTIK